MAETLGQAVLEVGVDDSRLRAGLAGVEQQAKKAGDALAKAAGGPEVEQRFTKTGQALQRAANGLEFFIDASGRARRENGQYVTTAEKVAAGIDRLGKSATGTGEQVERLGRRIGGLGGTNTIEALNRQLARTRERLEAAEIGSRVFRKLQRDVNNLERELAQAQNRTTRLGDAFGAVRNTLGALGAVQVFRGLIQAASELEGITRKLTNTLGEQGARQALGELRTLSDRLGISFTVLADSFGSFTAAASAAGISLSVQKDLFEAVSTSAQRLGLSNDAINGSLLALQQVAAKGTVQMEELRGQLGERLPTAFAATARGLGVSNRELIKLVESGELTADEFFPALTKGLAELNGSGEGGVLTAEQNFAAFGSTLKDLQADLGKEFLPGLIDFLKQLSEGLREFIALRRSIDIGNTTGLKTGVQTEQIGGQLEFLQRRDGLTKEQTDQVLAEALKQLEGSGGAKRNLFNQLVLTGEGPDSIESVLDDVSKRISKPGRDEAAQTEADIAAAAATQAADSKNFNTEAKVKERLKTLRKENEGLDFGSSKLAENNKEIATLEAQTVKGAERLEKAGAKIREEIEKGAERLVEAGTRLQQAEEGNANAIVGNLDIASDKAAEKARKTFEEDIRRNIKSGNIAPDRFARKFGGRLTGGFSVEVEENGKTSRQLVPQDIDLSGLSLETLKQASAQSSVLADAEAGVVAAQKELAAATKELNENLQVANGRESNLSITVPVGKTETLYLP